MQGLLPLFLLPGFPVHPCASIPMDAEAGSPVTWCSLYSYQLIRHFHRETWASSPPPLFSFLPVTVSSCLQQPTPSFTGRPLDHVTNRLVPPPIHFVGGQILGRGNSSGVQPTRTALPGLHSGFSVLLFRLEILSFFKEGLCIFILHRAPVVGYPCLLVPPKPFLLFLCFQK